MSVGWTFVEAASLLMERDEREVVLGDIAEAGENAWRGLLDVLGLALRRHLLLWKSWRPWVAAFGAALPASFLLIGVSLSVTCTFERLALGHVNSCWFTGHEGFGLFSSHVFLLIAWAWTTGFVLSSLSRATLWVSTACCLSAGFFCFGRFHQVAPSAFCMFLYLLPAAMGVRRGLRIPQLGLRSAYLLAATVTALMIFARINGALWGYNWLLIWPSWYLVATSKRQFGDKSPISSY
jgi:hypothetical protein